MGQNLISGLLSSDMHEWFSCLFAVSVHSKCTWEKKDTLFQEPPCENTGKVGIPRGFMKSAFEISEIHNKEPFYYE